VGYSERATATESDSFYWATVGTGLPRWRGVARSRMAIDGFDAAADRRFSARRC